MERQLQQVQIIKDRLSFKDGRYTVSYPYNTLIADLPENKRQCQLMMVSLERKLQKTNLINQFNEAVSDFMNRGVIQWVDELPALQGVSKRSYYTAYLLPEQE